MTTGVNRRAMLQRLGSVCTVASCAGGYGDCDGIATNGCETNTNINVSNCGTCGHGCSFANATAACSGGACVIASCNGG